MARGLGVAGIAAGAQHSLAVKADGSLWAWGWNKSGQLGDGTNALKTTPVRVMSNVASVAAGGYHTLAVQKDGSLWAWGSNDYGQLGDGTNASRNKPVCVMANVAAVAAGGYHTLAVQKDGSLWAWGRNYDGQLGDGAYTDRSTPVCVMTDVAAVAAGQYFSLAIQKDGSLWAWGNNKYYQLGDGTNTSRNKPVRVAADMASVAAGAEHSLAMQKDGSLWAWGRNAWGQLGDGTWANKGKPVLVMTNVASVAAGSYHTLAVQKDGSLWAWGENNHNQVGDGSYTDRNAPVRVLSNAASVAGGDSHSLATQQDGSLWAWGYNYYGQLGDGTDTDRGEPIPVPGMGGGEVAVTDVTLAPTAANLLVGESLTLNASVIPADATDKILRWSSGASSVAKVEDGLVTALAPGKATITATAHNGKSATCVVTVKAASVPVKTVKISPTTAKLLVGESLVLRAALKPANATDKSVTWSSSKPKIASAAQDGTVVAKKAGAAVITAKASNGKKATAKITVVAKPAYTIKLDKTTLKLNRNASALLKATVMPANGSLKLKWTSANKKIAAVDNKGLVTGKRPGTTTITVSLQSDGKIKATCKVVVVRG